MTNPPGLSRRRFLKRTTGAAAAGLAVPYFATGRVSAAPGRPGANEQIAVGFIGTGGRARQLMGFLPAGGRIVAVCDCYQQRYREALQQKQQDWPAYQHYREMLEKEKLDAVVVATPDHARVIPCLHALQAGLDIYAEKPLTLTIHEGRVLVDAVRKYKRVFQVGSQQRTVEMNAFACKLVRTGGLGKITRVQGICYPGPRDYEGLPEERVPAGDDWEVWQSRTEARPFNNALQFGWMGWRAYSGGEMTNWGAHGVDQVQWARGKSLTGPTEIWPVTPGANGKVSMRYADGVQVDYELEQGPFGGAIFHGTDAKLEIDRNRFAATPSEVVTNPPDPEVAKAWEGEGWNAGPHLQNWLDCIKTRRTPNADVEIGHRSISVCHLANFAREIGRKLRWDPDKEVFPGDDEANAYLERPRRKGWELPELT